MKILERILILKVVCRHFDYYVLYTKLFNTDVLYSKQHQSEQHMIFTHKQELKKYCGYRNLLDVFPLFLPIFSFSIFFELIMRPDLVRSSPMQRGDHVLSFGVQAFSVGVKATEI